MKRAKAEGLIHEEICTTITSIARIVRWDDNQRQVTQCYETIR